MGAEEKEEEVPVKAQLAARAVLEVHRSLMQVTSWSLQRHQCAAFHSKAMDLLRALQVLPEHLRPLKYLELRCLVSLRQRMRRVIHLMVSCMVHSQHHTFLPAGWGPTGPHRFITCEAITTINQLYVPCIFSAFNARLTPSLGPSSAFGMDGIRPLPNRRFPVQTQGLPGPGFIPVGL